MKLDTGRILDGPAGTATELVPIEYDRPDQEATVASWFLHCPEQSPAWENYVLAIIHLRDLPGVRPATVTVPGATHEVMLFALDPEPGPKPTDSNTWNMLKPANLIYQVELPDDAAATHLLELVAQTVVDGILWAEPPLSGQTHPWDSALVKTAAHLRGEEHAP